MGCYPARSFGQYMRCLWFDLHKNQPEIHNAFQPAKRIVEYEDVFWNMSVASSLTNYHGGYLRPQFLAGSINLTFFQPTLWFSLIKRSFLKPTSNDSRTKGMINALNWLLLIGSSSLCLAISRKAA